MNGIIFVALNKEVQTFNWIYSGAGLWFDESSTFMSLIEMVLDGVMSSALLNLLHAEVFNFHVMKWQDHSSHVLAPSWA